MRVLLLNKPFRVLPQFTDPAGRATLRDYVSLRGVYPAGRLDYDSEGLMLLTDHGAWQARVSDPRSGFTKTYLAQVEGVPTEQSLDTLRRGVMLGDGPARPIDVRVVPEPVGLWPRDPPIRYRRQVPTAWLELVLTEGRNRQVRRMTAAVQLPTLRLVRWAIGPWTVAGLAPGTWAEVPRVEAERVLGAAELRRNAPGSQSASRVRVPARRSASDRPATDRRARDRRR